MASVQPRALLGVSVVSLAVGMMKKAVRLHEMSIIPRKAVCQLGIQTSLANFPMRVQVLGRRGDGKSQSRESGKCSMSVTR